MLYRFRNLERMLGERGELQNQYFYFSSPAQQNDPFEGYVEYSWHGDNIAWLGLFKHYVWQVYMTLSMLPLQPPIDNLKKLYLSHTEIYWKDTKLPEMRLKLEENFSTNIHIKLLADSLGRSNMQIHKRELRQILFVIHNMALQYANQAIREIGISVFTDEDFFGSYIASVAADIGIDTFIRFLNSKEFDKNKLSAMASAVEQEVDALQLYQHVKQCDITNVEDRNRVLHIMVEFPQVYANRVTWLSFPDWYCVCFNDDYSNPALWGYYADSHRGVCLIFKPKCDSEFNLRNLSLGSDAKAERFNIHQMQYGKEPIQIDFFSSLGWLWGDERSHWLVQNGMKSSTLVDMFKNETMWREQFQYNNTERFLRKNISWEHEHEYRIVLDDLWIGHHAEEQRKFQYDFNDLEGLIFGIRTPQKEKASIIKIIQQKCIEHGRQDFHLYQASQNGKTGKIEKAPIRFH